MRCHKKFGLDFGLVFKKILYIFYINFIIKLSNYISISLKYDIIDNREEV